MSINSKKEDFQTMINGLQNYISSLEENTQELKRSAELYDRGINDRSSHVYKEKIDKLCNQINPSMVERVEILKKNLEEQLEELIGIEEMLEREENE